MRILCAGCGAETEESECGACGASPLLDGRYRLLEVVGRGAMGTTYRADLDGQQVAVKEMLVRAADVLKQRELFHREADTLQTLTHPGVPRYIDHFDVAQGKVWAMYVVQSFVDGETLDAERTTRRYTEPEVAATLADVAEVLAYLHALRPPVVHRDLKPGNVMRRPDGQVVLIDFGSVKSALEDPGMGGSTVAGTFGYMPPEQLVGRAEPASDLYALGMIGAVLLTRKPAVDLVRHDGVVEWQKHTRVGAALGGVLDELLARDVDLRPKDAGAVAGRLRAIAEGKPDPEPRALTVHGDGLDLRVDLPSPPRAPRLRDTFRVGSGESFKLLFGGIFGGIGVTVGLVLTLVGFFGGGPLLLGIVGAAVGLLFGGIGGGIFFSGVRGIARSMKLLTLGRAVDGVIEHAALNTNVRVNGRSPTVIEYRYVLDGVEYRGSESRYDQTLPSNLFGARVTVLVHPDAPDHSQVVMERARRRLR